MTHLKNRNRMRPLLVVIGLVALAGCSTLPTAPITDAPSGQTSNVAVPDASDPQLLGGIVGGIVGGIGGIVGGVVNPIIPPIVHPIVVGADSIIRTMPIVGGTGGVLENGDVTLTIPDGAIRGDAEVKVIVPDSTQLHCVLEITPASANGFDIPVTLSMNVAGLPHMERLGIEWFNPVTQEWEAVDSQVNVATGRVEALLPHFSEYRVAEAFRSKVGW